MTINLEKSLDIDAPIEDVFAVWADVESHPFLLPHGEGAQLELTEQVEGERLGWRISGGEVASTVTAQFEAAGDEGTHTRVTLSAHYPNGIGPSGSVVKVTAGMEAQLANVARLLRGEALVMAEEDPHDEEVEVPTYPAVTDSAAVLQGSLSAATEAWVSSVNRSFQIFSALAWWPFLQSPFLQGAFAQGLSRRMAVFNQTPLHDG